MVRLSIGLLKFTHIEMTCVVQIEVLANYLVLFIYSIIVNQQEREEISKIFVYNPDRLSQ